MVEMAPKERRVLFHGDSIRDVWPDASGRIAGFRGGVPSPVVGGSLAASPAAAASPPAWTAYVVSNATDAVIPVNTATDAVGTPIAVGSGPSAIAITPDASTAYVTRRGHHQYRSRLRHPHRPLDANSGYAP